ncbi:MAG: hypothetical protein P8X63_06420, partial [Desulfuromonadaceae bacterium]
MYRKNTGILQKSLRYAPLTLSLLATLVPDDLGFDIKIVDEGVDDITFREHVDLVAISAITGTSV